MKEIATAAQVDVGATGNWTGDAYPGNPGFTSMTSWPTPPCPGWKYDWDNWGTLYGGNAGMGNVGVVRITLLTPTNGYAYFYCVDSTDPTCMASFGGAAIDIRNKPAKTFSCNE